MNPKDLERWAAKFAKKGTRAAVELEDDDAPPPRQARDSRLPASWGRPAAAPAYNPPARPGQVWGPPPETDVLVKPAPSAYADMLSRVPDLAPDMTGGSDSMSGHMSPESRAAVEEALRGELQPDRVRPEDPRDDVPRSRFGGNAAAIVPLADLQNKPN